MGVRLEADRVFHGGAGLAGGTLTFPDGRFIAPGQAHDTENPIVLSLDENGDVTIPNDVPAAEYYAEALNAAGDLRFEGIVNVPAL